MAWVDIWAAIPVETYDHAGEMDGTGERPMHTAGRNIAYAGNYVTLDSNFGPRAGERYWLGRVYGEEADIQSIEGASGVYSVRAGTQVADAILDRVQAYLEDGTLDWPALRTRLKSRRASQRVVDTGGTVYP